MVERLAISVAGPFVERVKIANKRIGSFLSAAHHYLMAVDFPYHIVTWLQPKRKPNSTRNGGLGLRRDSAEDHVGKVRDFLTFGK
jgi:hypothetical protein